MTNLELTKRVAELLGYMGIIADSQGDLKWLVGFKGGNHGYIPHFATDLNACEAIWRDERVAWWIFGDVAVWLGPRSGRLEDGGRIKHDNSAPGIARAICEAFIELCEKEKGK